ncbi:hypothetical protein EYF80_004321 [Liparis tanakae]|uniref:Uncharacterized protein n=1 Tax=Liparis tanakae TaxID=230148 RepID=A0A4Z2J522_9TELE|nr:hypothetical protein EYF80_004321 [Liparis tanakae]
MLCGREGDERAGEFPGRAFTISITREALSHGSEMSNRSPFDPNSERERHSYRCANEPQRTALERQPHITAKSNR